MKKIIALLAAVSICAAAPKLPVDPSTWRGFNLMEKLDINWMKNAPYRESDFALIAEFGFNYVRVPLDYRCYTASNDWLIFREDVLTQIDDAVRLGEKYKIHVTLGLHRAPGYCINPPPETKDLWTDEGALSVFAAHWTMFAKRYRTVPPERLSFNLINEPSRTARENVVRVYERAIASIREVDSTRIILIDGDGGGNNPYSEFLSHGNIIQAGRGYYPAISTYKASYRDKSRDLMPMPIWPMKPTLPGNLYGSDKASDGLQTPLILAGNFKRGTRVGINVWIVSRKAAIIAKADGVVVWEKVFEPKDGPGEWKTVDYKKEYDRYQNLYAREYEFILLTAAKEISIENIDGDWLRFNDLSLTEDGGKKNVYRTDTTPRVNQGRFHIEADGSLLPPEGFDAEYPNTKLIAPWKDIAARGAAVFIGEWGAYNKTPHTVLLPWMKSWLTKCRDANFGWALWNFRGEFGVADSGRADVVYEEYKGIKLDRKMMDLLREYLR